MCHRYLSAIALMPARGWLRHTAIQLGCEACRSSAGVADVWLKGAPSCRLQVFGPAWHEASVLAVAQVLQTALPGVRDALPRRHVAVNPLRETASVADPDEA